MAKRSATSDLNHDNWNAKDEKEDPGSFTPLTGSGLQNRVIRKAKRSLNSPAVGGSPASSSPFAKFSGFSSSAASSPFFSAVNKTNSPFLAATSTTENTSETPFPVPKENTIGKDSSSFFSMTKKDIKETPNGNPEENMNIKSVIDDSKKSSSSPAPLSSEPTQVKQSRGMEYCKQLKSLNESVLKWMQLHLTKNVCSDFTPVFNDYKKHLDSLNMKYPVRKNENTILQQGTDAFKKPSPSRDNHSNSTAQSSFHKETKQQQDETDYGAHFTSNTTNTSTFSFGIKLTPTATSSNSPLGPNSSSQEGDKQNNNEESKSSSQFSTGFFSQNNKEEDKSSSQFSAGFFSQNNKEENKGLSQFSAGFFSKGFQSGTDKPFSFATAPMERSAEQDKEEEYVPPKNDFVAVSEEDALYSKRCKLFFKKDDAFADKGVGTLYLKSLEETTQLLIRADTSLGNILLNIRLSASLPISRSGKNNVMLVCIPNPPMDAKNPDKAIPLLIRVKTSEDADELLETLNKYKS